MNLKFFGGLTNRQIAELHDVTERKWADKGLSAGVNGLPKRGAWMCRQHSSWLRQG